MGLLKIPLIPFKIFTKKGKKQTFGNKYDMFKNDKRRGVLKTSNIFLNILCGLALLGLGVCIAVIGFSFVWWLMGTIITLGLAFKKVTAQSMLWLKTGMYWGAIAIIVFAAAFLLRFIVEWVIMLAESKALKKQPVPEENQKYIAVSQAVKKATLSDILFSGGIILLLGGAFGIAYKLGKLNTVTKGSVKNVDKTIVVISLVLLLFAAVLAFIKRATRRKIYASVEDEIVQIRQERKEPGKKEKTKEINITAAE